MHCHVNAAPVGANRACEGNVAGQMMRQVFSPGLDSAGFKNHGVESKERHGGSAVPARQRGVKPMYRRGDRGRITA